MTGVNPVIPYPLCVPNNFECVPHVNMAPGCAAYGVKDGNVHPLRKKRRNKQKTKITFVNVKLNYVKPNAYQNLWNVRFKISAARQKNRSLVLFAMYWDSILLDFEGCRGAFVCTPWSLKRLHKLISLS